MLRDIDYAAAAVKTAIIEKFSGKHELQGLCVTANDKTITVDDDGRTAEGTRDALLAATRKANDYDQLWTLMPKDGNA